MKPTSQFLKQLRDYMDEFIEKIPVEADASIHATMYFGDFYNYLVTGKMPPETNEMEDRIEADFEDIWQIPANKILGLRFGQLIHNALRLKYQLKKDGAIGDKLFNIENKDLIKIVNDFLKRYEAKR